MLGLSVVDGDGGISELPGLGHVIESHDSRRCLLRCTQNAAQQVRAFGVDDGREIGAVVDHHLRRVPDGGANVPIIGLVVLAVDRVRGNPVFRDKGGRNVVLRTQRVAGTQHSVRSSSLQREHQIGRFCRYVGAGHDPDAFQRAFPGEPVTNLRHDVHLARGPRDSSEARRCQGKVLDVSLILLRLRSHSFRLLALPCREWQALDYLRRVGSDSSSANGSNRVNADS